MSVAEPTGEPLDTVSLWILVRWACVASLGFAAAVMVSRWLSITSPRVLALQALTPLWLVLVAVVAVISLARRDRAVAFVAIALTAGHVAAVAPAVWPRPTPAWADDPGAQQVTMLVANLYYFNEDPTSVEPLLATEAEILVLAEVTEAWPDRLEQAGLFETYPHHVVSRNGRPSETIILSKLPILELRWGAGPVALPIAVIDVQGVELMVMGVHPPAPVDPAGRDRWNATLERVETTARRRAEVATVFAGDFNATRWHAPFHDLLEAGLVDAHEQTGAGLTRSWPVGRRYPPFMRLDHALMTDGVTALDTREITVPGSDHRAFEVDLAIRPAA